MAAPARSHITEIRRKHAGLRWQLVVAPTRQDLDRLREEGFRPDDLAHAIDPRERSRVRVSGNTALFVLRMARARGASRAPLTTVPFAILLRPGHGLIVSSVEHEILESLTSIIESSKHGDGTSGERVVLHAIELVAKDFLERLVRIEEAVDHIEDRLGRSLGNAEVLRLLQHQKSLMHFAVALDDIHVMLEHMQRIEMFRPDAKDEAWLEDVLVEVRQALDTARLASDVLSQMMDAFASIISNNLNVVMKFLASVTVVLTVPLLVSSVYGMNVGLPGQRSSFAFPVLVALSLAASALLVVLLRRKRWL